MANNSYDTEVLCAALQLCKACQSECESVAKTAKNKAENIKSEVIIGTALGNAREGMDEVIKTLNTVSEQWAVMEKIVSKTAQLVGVTIDDSKVSFGKAKDDLLAVALKAKQAGKA